MCCPLFFVTSDRAKIAEVLIQNGAEINILNSYQKTPLEIAAWGGNLMSIYFINFQLFRSQKESITGLSREISFFHPQIILKWPMCFSEMEQIRIKHFIFLKE